MPKLFWIILTMLEVDHSQECEKVLQQECAGIREFFQHSQLTFQVLQHTYEKIFFVYTLFLTKSWIEKPYCKYYLQVLYVFLVSNRHIYSKFITDYY